LVSSFFRDHGVRETIESIIVAVMLALMFKAFEAEAYIIPTGSMAPTLRGEHFDLVCEQCHFPYQTNCSPNLSNVRSGYCPICRYRTTLKPELLSDHNSFDGDRILVNKFIYDFADPERWDVIVFKNPKNAKQNYIKRLVGLPRESLLIENGDIFTFDPERATFAERKIARKSPLKLQSMMQIVDDSNYVGDKLVQAGWPSRWLSVGSEGEPRWTEQGSGSSRQFEIRAAGDEQVHWMRYRHLVPRIDDWNVLEKGRLPERLQPIASGASLGGGLVRDHYAYNELSASTSQGLFTEPSGLHWVGDLGVEVWGEFLSEGGEFRMETTEGSATFECRVDLATGSVTLHCSDAEATFVDGQGNSVATPTAQSSIRGTGRHKMLFIQADDRLFVRIDGRFLNFGGLPYQDVSRANLVVPVFRDGGPDDSLPLGVGSRGADVRITRLKVWRDVYYTSVTPEFKHWDYRVNLDLATLDDILETPARWESETAKRLFASRDRSEMDLHRLGDGQYFPMGDNSPSSQDARLWGEPAYVQRDLLLGRGLFLYWPHSLNRPVFGFPDFSRMKFIR
jgi:signal peptidase I